jgi:hypothetical protein
VKFLAKNKAGLVRKNNFELFPLLQVFLLALIGMVHTEPLNFCFYFTLFGCLISLINVKNVSNFTVERLGKTNADFNFPGILVFALQI